MARNEFVRQYTLADYFDRTGWMTARTWKTTLLVSAIGIVVPALLAAGAFARLFGMLARVAEMAYYATPVALLNELGGNITLGVLAGILSALGLILVNLAITHHARDVVFGDPRRPSEYIGIALRESFGKAIWQGILIGLIFAAIVFGPSTFVAILVAVFGMGAGGVALAVIVTLGTTVAGIWLAYSLLVAQQAIVFDGERGAAAMAHSIRLVRGNWWRIFGITLLVQLILSFVIGLISTPIVGASFLPMVSRFVELATRSHVDEVAILRVFESLGGGFAFAIGAGLVVQQLVTVLIMAPFHSLIYVDLKLRHKEIAPAESEQLEPKDDATPGSVETGSGGPENEG